MPITCPSCGKLTSEKNLLCTYCSQPLMPPSKCKSCGREVPANRAQCLYCGTPIPRATMPAPLPVQPMVAPKPVVSPAELAELFRASPAPKGKKRSPILYPIVGGASILIGVVIFVALYITAKHEIEKPKAPVNPDPIQSFQPAAFEPDAQRTVAGQKISITAEQGCVVLSSEKGTLSNMFIINYQEKCGQCGKSGRTLVSEFVVRDSRYNTLNIQHEEIDKFNCRYCRFKNNVVLEFRKD